MKTETEWNECTSAAQLIKSAHNHGVETKKILRATLDCVKSIEHLLEDPCSKNSLRIANDYMNGAEDQQSESALDAAVYNALDAADYADNTAADDPSNAALDDNANLTYSVYAAVCAVSYYADADDFYTAADAAAANAATAVRYADKYSPCADIVRQHISYDDLKIED